MDEIVSARLVDVIEIRRRDETGSIVSDYWLVDGTRASVNTYYATASGGDASVPRGGGPFAPWGYCPPWTRWGHGGDGV